ncbi:MAG: glycosyltransferase [Bacteroidales bacterium]|nr:glycosyltransferase [Bacteroidales bacterium]
MTPTRIYVAIPAMDELHDLPLTLQDLAAQQVRVPFEVHVCVNQPETYWEDDQNRLVCIHNQELLSFLKTYSALPVQVLDYASPGKGWKGKNFGVGWARKMLFENILKSANPEDLIISLDADTRIKQGYLQSIADNFVAHPEWPAIAVPYYHPLTGDEARDRAVLRYEFYMRNYAINLLRIGSPYGFTAIGSAIAMRTSALRKIGGITPLKSGEDFYLMQKMRKMAVVGLYNEECVYPAARYSTRVAFGTGPAMMKGSEGNWDSYPIFAQSCFESIAESYNLLPQLYLQDVHTDFLDFLQVGAKTEVSLWQSIRQNVKDLPHFIQAFHEKADGLRILQFVRRQHKNDHAKESSTLYENLSSWIPETIPSWWNPELPFEQLSLEQMNDIRNLLFHYENELRKKIDDYKYYSYFCSLKNTVFKT